MLESILQGFQGHGSIWKWNWFLHWSIFQPVVNKQRMSNVMGKPRMNPLLPSLWRVISMRITLQDHNLTCFLQLPAGLQKIKILVAQEKLLGHNNWLYTSNIDISKASLARYCLKIFMDPGHIWVVLGNWTPVKLYHWISHLSHDFCWSCRGTWFYSSF